MLKTKCFIIGGTILSSLLQAQTPDPVKCKYPTLEEIEFHKKKVEEFKREQSIRDIERAYDLEREAKKQKNEIEILKMQVERLNNKFNDIERDKILNAPLPKMHPPVLFR